MDNTSYNLNVIKGLASGQSFKLKNGITYIGRDPKDDIQIKDKTLSRRHARIIRKNNIFFIEDLGSHNGTWIDGNRLKPNKEIKLNEGVSFTVGNTLLRIESPSSGDNINRERQIKSDTWQVIDDRKNVKDIIKYLVANKELINVQIKGDDEIFNSMFIKLDDESLFSTFAEHASVIIEKLTPGRGNRLIQSVSEVDVNFLLKNHIWQCNLEYGGISSIKPHLGFIMKLPAYIEVRENRDNPRSMYEIMGFVSVEFSVKEGPEKDKVYNLDVIDCSKKGLGLLISKKDSDLAKLLKKEDRIADITFYSEETMIRVDGTVRHISEIKEGQNKGCYLLGLESSAIISSCKSA
ncbi:FHA domain-containing protein [Thermodesulfobacteriota bacterium]